MLKIILILVGVVVAYVLLQELMENIYITKPASILCCIYLLLGEIFGFTVQSECVIVGAVAFILFMGTHFMDMIFGTIVGALFITVIIYCLVANYFPLIVYLFPGILILINIIILKEGYEI